MTPTTPDAIHEPTHHQIHEAFLFFRLAKPPAALYLEGMQGVVLVELASKVNALSVAPKSVSVLTEDDNFLFCIGYDAAATYPVQFTVELIGDVKGALPDLQQEMGEAAETADMLCHDLFQIPDSDTGLLYALLMVRG